MRSSVIKQLGLASQGRLDHRRLMHGDEPDQRPEIRDRRPAGALGSDRAAPDRG